MTDFPIRIVISGGSAAQRDIDQTRRSLAGLENQGLALIRTFSGIFAFAGLQRGIQTLIGFQDELTDFQNRLRLVVDSEEEVRDVTQELFDIAQRTRVEFGAVSTVYSRTALAASMSAGSSEPRAEMRRTASSRVSDSPVRAFESRSSNPGSRRWCR